MIFVPELAAALAGHWMLDRRGRFTAAAFTAQTGAQADLVDPIAATTPPP